MSLPSLPPALTPALGDREAISDAVYRCVVALDTDNKDLLVSAFTKDAVFDLNGTIMNGLEDIVAQCYQSIVKMDTTHFITNIRINVVEESRRAELTCSALAQHYNGGEGMKPGAVPLLAGSLYWLQLVKDQEDGLWKAKHWKVKSTWGQGNWGVFSH